jgi:hypothetical protein
MKTITKVKNLTVNINYPNDSQKESESDRVKDSEKMELLVETLRIIALDKFFEDKTIIVPDGCEKNGFVQGEFKLPHFLYFIADMLEE